MVFSSPPLLNHSPAPGFISLPLNRSKRLLCQTAKCFACCLIKSMHLQKNWAVESKAVFFWFVSVLAGVYVCMSTCTCMLACVCVRMLDTVCTCICVWVERCVHVCWNVFVCWMLWKLCVCVHILQAGVCVSLYVFIGKCVVSVVCVVSVDSWLSPWLSLLPWLIRAEKVMSKQTCLTPHIREMITYPCTSLRVGPVSMLIPSLPMWPKWPCLCILNYKLT